jgi:hypothetical protein
MAGDPESKRLAVGVDTTSAAEARRFLRSTLREWQRPELEDPALLLVSELVTNVVLHARTSGEVVVALHPSALRVEVHDQSDRLPVPKDHGLQAGTGRGLTLVAALSSAWGAEPTGVGKVVWFELAAPTRPVDDGADRRADLPFS